jgi:hypothetical protein
VSNQLNAEVERINDSWAALDRVIRVLSEERLVMLKWDGWSLKDHLAHMALAEQYCLAALHEKPPHTVFGINAEALLRLSEDELNEIGYRRTHALSLAQVMDMRQQAHQALMHTLTRLGDADLQRRFAPAGSEDAGATMLDILRGNTYAHYDAHRGWIEAALAPGN